MFALMMRAVNFREDLASMKTILERTSKALFAEKSRNRT